MGVLRKMGVKAVLTPGRLQSLDFTYVNQNVQVAVHRSEADPGILFPDELMHFIR